MAILPLFPFPQGKRRSVWTLAYMSMADFWYPLMIKCTGRSIKFCCLLAVRLVIEPCCPWRRSFRAKLVHLPAPIWRQMILWLFVPFGILQHLWLVATFPCRSYLCIFHNILVAGWEWSVFLSNDVVFWISNLSIRVSWFYWLLPGDWTGSRFASLDIVDYPSGTTL